MLGLGDIRVQSGTRCPPPQNSITAASQPSQASSSSSRSGRAGMKGKVIDLTDTDDEGEEEPGAAETSVTNESSIQTSAIRRVIHLDDDEEELSATTSRAIWSSDMAGILQSPPRGAPTSISSRQSFKSAPLDLQLSSFLPGIGGMSGVSGSSDESTFFDAANSSTFAMERSFSSSSSFDFRNGSRKSTPATSVSDGEEKLRSTDCTSRPRVVTNTKGKGRALEQEEVDSEDEYIGSAKKSVSQASVSAASFSSSTTTSTTTSPQHLRKHFSKKVRYCTCTDDICPGSSDIALCTRQTASPPKDASPEALVDANSTCHHISSLTVVKTSLSALPRERDIVDRAPPLPPPLPLCRALPIHFVLAPEVQEGKLSDLNVQELQQEIMVLKNPLAILESARQSKSTSLCRLTGTSTPLRMTDVPGTQRLSRKQRRPKRRERSSSTPGSGKSRAHKASQGDGDAEKEDGTDSDGGSETESEVEESDSEKYHDAEIRELYRHSRGCMRVVQEEGIDECFIARKRKVPHLEEAAPDSYGGEYAGYLAPDLLDHELPDGGVVGKKARPRSTGADVSARKYGLFEEVAEEFAPQAPPKNKKRKSSEL